MLHSHRVYKEYINPLYTHTYRYFGSATLRTLDLEKSTLSDNTLSRSARIPLGSKVAQNVR